jgi:hypothetical protein
VSKVAASAAKTEEDNSLRVTLPEGKTEARALADIAIDPAAHAASSVVLFTKGTFGKTAVTDAYEAVADSAAKVRNGDMAGPEAMLAAQAISLNAIFTEMARRSALNMGEYIKASESYMRLALKAQAQCRATIETLATIKNPPVVFARQANIAHGPQQVNNHGSNGARADNSTSARNEQLGAEHGERLDAGTQGAAIGGDRPLEAVGALHRPSDGSGQGNVQPERLQGREARRAA